jgi:hypothetical protein
VLVNDKEPEQVRVRGKRVLIRLMPEMAVPSRVCRVHVCSSDAPVAIRYVVLAPNWFSSAVTLLGKVQIRIWRLKQSINKRM